MEIKLLFVIFIFIGFWFYITERFRNYKHSDSAPDKDAGECIFCGRRGKMSKQHLFPKYLKRYIPDLTDKNHLRISTELDSITPKSKTASGNLSSFGLKVVCIKCNTGWMSRIEDRLKESFLRIIKGEAFTIDKSQQKLLYKWAVMEAIVGSSEQNAIESINKVVRKSFMIFKLPPRGWKVWIGKISSDPEWNYRYKQNVSHISRTSKEAAYFGQSSTLIFQFCLFAIGNLIVYVASSPVPNIDLEYDEDYAQYLIQIYPSTNKLINWKSQKRMPKYMLIKALDYFPNKYFPRTIS